MTAEEHPEFRGRCRDGTAVFSFSDPEIIATWAAEREQVLPRAHTNGNNGHDLYAADIPPVCEEPGTADSLDQAIEYRQRYLRINREAKRRLDAEDQPPVQIPAIQSLDDLLAEADAPTQYLIERVAPVDSRIILSAPHKAGKSTLIGNLVRALADQDAFLGRFDVRAACRRIVLIDNEMPKNMLRHWLRDQRIDRTDAIADVISLRGKAGALDLTDDRRLREWVERLRGVGCDYLIVDCLRPILDAIGLDENHDVGRFLVRFDALLTDAGISGAMLVHHMGHSGERARGDSRLQDWPDAIWRIVRESEEQESSRYFSVYGRDVNVPEGRLVFDGITRRMTYSTGSRRDTKVEAAYIAVITLLAEVAKAGGIGKSKNEIESELDNPRLAVREALTRAVQHKIVTAFRGDRGAHMRCITNPCQRCGLPLSGQEEVRHLNCSPLPKVPEGLFE